MWIKFKQFFSRNFSKPFLITCFSVIVAGILYAWFSAFYIKNNIDAKIEQREGELAYEIFGQSYKQAKDAYTKAKENYEACLARHTGCFLEGTTWFGYKDSEDRANADPEYQELLHIKEISVFRTFLRSFLKNFSFGWWGIIALVLVFFVNVFIATVKLLKHFIPAMLKGGSTRIALIGGDIFKMPAFQRYFLLIALLILVTLIFIVIRI